MGLNHQWSFQEPKLEVPTIYKAYISGLNFREYPHKIWPEIWYERTSIESDPEITIDNKPGRN